MEQQLISLSDIKVGDEIIISCYSGLKYLKVKRLPTKKDSTTFKVSLRRDERSNSNFKWYVNVFEQDVAKHNHTAYQDLYSRAIFLVKRENNN